MTTHDLENRSPALSDQAERTEGGNVPTPRRRGFAAMTPEKQRELSSRGGKASHQKGRGHEWTTEAARAAGRKGGLASRGGRGKGSVPPPGNPVEG
jgi:general stress protein YciG